MPDAGKVGLDSDPLWGIEIGDALVHQLEVYSGLLHEITIADALVWNLEGESNALHQVTIEDDP